MAVVSTSESDPKIEEVNQTKGNGIRVVGGRNYDPENGKTCHQCRQRTINFSAPCKNMRKDKQCTLKYCHKCLINRYGEAAEDVAVLVDWRCPKCRDICNCSCCMKRKGQSPTGILVHTAKKTGFTSVSDLLQAKGPGIYRYEKIVKDTSVLPKKQTKESMATSPRILGKENSFDGDCDSKVSSQNMTSSLPDEKKSKKMKREGLKELSNGKGGQEDSLDKTSLRKPKSLKEPSKKRESATSDEEPRKKLKSKGKYAGEEKNLKRQDLESNTIPPVKKNKGDVKSEYSGGSNDSNDDNASGKLQSVIKPCRDEKLDIDIPLPQGTCLITVAGVDLPPKDVGHALQFLEFCAAFGEVFDMKKGQAESVIREIIRGRGRCRLQYSPVVQIHTQLLSLIEKDMGKKFSPFRDNNGSWFRALGQCVSESQCSLNEVSSDIYDSGVEAYNTLDSSIKFKLLNILCDEVLCTTTLRDWIDKQNSKLVDDGKETREKIVVARDKEKQLRQKMQDEIVKAIIEKNGALLSVSEHETLIAQIKNEAAQAHEDMLQAMAKLPNKRQRSDAVRTSSILLDVSGHVFWKLRGYTSENCILLQDIGTLDPVAPDEKWFVYDVEQKPHVEKYISSIRSKRLRIQKVSDSLPTGSVGENLEIA